MTLPAFSACAVEHNLIGFYPSFPARVWGSCRSARTPVACIIISGCLTLFGGSFLSKPSHEFSRLFQ